MVRRTTGPVAVPTTMLRSSARWWVRASTVGVTAAALVGVYLVPAVPAFAAADDGLSEADRAAAAAAAAPPADTSPDQDGDAGGNWFTDLFGGGDDEPEGDPIPADAPLATQQHPVDAPVATPGEPGERVRELTGKRTVNTRTFLLDDGQRQVEVSAEPLFYESRCVRRSPAVPWSRRTRTRTTATATRPRMWPRRRMRMLRVRS